MQTQIPNMQRTINASMLPIT